jgi:hypothetical protein
MTRDEWRAARDRARGAAEADAGRGRRAASSRTWAVARTRDERKATARGAGRRGARVHTAVEPFAFLDDDLLPRGLTLVEPIAFALARAQALCGVHGPRN